MPANDHIGFHTRESPHDGALPRQPGENLVFITRCPVAKEHFTQVADFEAQCLWPGAQDLLSIGTELFRGPAYRFFALFRHATRVLSGPCRQHRNLAIAIDKISRGSQLPQTRKRFQWHRPGENVAANNDPRYSEPRDFF